MRMEELPPFYLKTHSDVDAQILNQLVLIIIFVRVESIHKVSIIVDGIHSSLQTIRIPQNVD